MSRRAGSDSVSDAELEECMLTSAVLVDRYGDEMLPILQRFEAEYEARKNRESAADRIKRKLGK